MKRLLLLLICLLSLAMPLHTQASAPKTNLHLLSGHFLLPEGYTAPPKGILITIDTYRVTGQGSSSSLQFSAASSFTIPSGASSTDYHLEAPEGRYLYLVHQNSRDYRACFWLDSFGRSSGGATPDPSQLPFYDTAGIANRRDITLIPVLKLPVTVTFPAKSSSGNTCTLRVYSELIGPPFDEQKVTFRSSPASQKILLSVPWYYWKDFYVQITSATPGSATTTLHVTPGQWLKKGSLDLTLK